ncbi:pro-sigmaK processing inhibitor BofA [Clostridium botulinum]|uniref:Sigma-K factor processing regulatory protein BofA n=2 Tax=Clostridium botulinum TaxID=1491 RepID=B2TR51_CLOBB|nr:MULTISPECIES: pro-sigmaK processing inhibitor BofA family protein [Clostridium]ACD24368.1 sigma-K factor processing regulatory protein BofA [Clostridium botulinum B str. Eklund 17B (NRP)]AIY80708.1 pro-sigmaK processing inhibitor BofA family protein [Clostridium botulinum 202F]ACD53134.1 sigma-K factor processing regulatory protein BofA [Clostridium botulinum E3 str. Alaska E43]AJF31005.1 pro-sigmaK processing inhibitor BofA [Clostridium botulinum]AJF34067.1 pro-sigmaK processing inhibitor 
MNEQYIIYGLIGLVLLFVMIKLLKWPLKILINGVLGVVILYVVNLVGANFNFGLAINPITALIAGFLGIPGVILLAILQVFL